VFSRQLHIIRIWYATVKKLVLGPMQNNIEAVEELASTVSRCVLFLPLSWSVFPEKEQVDES
jgi:hypothetical protein